MLVSTVYVVAYQIYHPWNSPVKKLIAVFQDKNDALNFQNTYEDSLLYEEKIKLSSKMNEVKEIFINWDPVGIRNVPEASDEYDTNVQEVYRILKSKYIWEQDQEEIYQELDNYFIQLEKDLFGGNYESTTRESLINKLLALDISEKAA